MYAQDLGLGAHMDVCESVYLFFSGLTFPLVKGWEQRFLQTKAKEFMTVLLSEAQLSG